MSNILLTGGRSPAALELARAFHRAGHTVYMAESLRGYLSRPSNAIRENFIVPPPRQKTAAFLNALNEIVKLHHVALIVPANEEAFYVAMGRDQLPAFVEPIEGLRGLHNKWDFNAHADSLGLPVPEAILIESQDDLLDAYSNWKGLVLKPVYSRFASRTLILPTLKQTLSTLTFDPAAPWVAQEFMEGAQLCTYSIAHHGHITAHTAYRSEFTAGQGATIVFQHVDHPAAFGWVTQFIEAIQFTGQIAFDFVETADGQVYALECNPRATSGVHLLASHPQFTEAFLNPSLDCITPSDQHSSMLSSAMLIYGLPTSIQKRQFSRWLRTFLSSNDTILSWNDPLPALLQTRSILHYLNLARQRGITPLEASTLDIEWNGEEIQFL